MFLLHHVFGEVNGKEGRLEATRSAAMGAITQAMAAAARAAGVEISLEAPVARVLVDGGRLRASASRRARRCMRSWSWRIVGPRLLYERLIDPVDLDADFLRRITCLQDRNRELSG